MIATDYRRLQERMVALIRAFGLHRPDRTPCGQPISVSEAHTLMELDLHGALSQTDLARCVQLDKSTVSRLVHTLERRHWISRSRCDRDGRVRLLRLTEQGKRMAEQLRAAQGIKFSTVLERIPAERQEAVLEVLDVLVQAMQDGEKEEKIPS
ncbi:MAG: MarR family transcriptional regulator [Thermaerobacterales bacterium]